MNEVHVCNKIARVKDEDSEWVYVRGRVAKHLHHTRDSNNLNIREVASLFRVTSYPS